jgi:excisionase family DNA binding protein
MTAYLREEQSVMLPDAVPSERYLRTSEVAPIMHVSSKTVSRWAKEGKLPFLLTLGGHRRYPEQRIRAIVAGLREGGENYPGPWQDIQTPPQRQASL